MDEEQKAGENEVDGAQVEVKEGTDDEGGGATRADAAVVDVRSDGGWLAEDVLVAEVGSVAADAATIDVDGW